MRQRNIFPSQALTWALLIAVALGLATSGQPVAAAEPESTPERAARLVQSLGSTEFTVREQAAVALLRLGAEAQTALEQGAQSQDAEVAQRCGEILGLVREAEAEAQLVAFTKDRDGSQGTSLPGWKVFRESVGSDEASRELFVMMHRLEPKLLRSLDGNLDEAADLLRGRTQALYRLAYQSTGVSQHLALGQAASLFFVASYPDLNVINETMAQLLTFSFQPSVKQALGEESPTKRLISRWVESTVDKDGAYYGLRLALQHDMPSGLAPALAIAQQPGVAPAGALQRPGVEPQMLQFGVMGVARFGGKENIAALAPLLGDDAVCYAQNRNGQLYTTQIRDLALASIVHLSGQKFENFGLPQVESNSQTVFNPTSVGFADEQSRTAALRTMDDWLKKHADR